MALSFFGMASLLPYTAANSAYGDTVSVAYPLCNVNAVAVTTSPTDSSTGMVTISLGGGNAFTSSCNQYDGFVGLAVLDGSANGQLVAVALGDDSTATASESSIQTPGAAIAPFGHAQGGNVNVGCTNDGDGVSSQWCPFFQTYVSSTAQLGLNSFFTVAGFPACGVANAGALFTDPLGTDWLCNELYLSGDSIIYGWTPIPVGRDGCPELKGDPGTSSEIIDTYAWIVNGGCPVPLRRGIYAWDGFGLGKLQYRYEHGDLAHDYSQYAQGKWRMALMRSPALQDEDGPGPQPRQYCHYVKYNTPDGIKRTMKVIVSDTNYEGDKGLKGILTAYWVPGHTDKC